MRRSTLATLSPSQTNSRSRPPPRGAGTKQFRASLPHGPGAKINGRQSLSHRASMHGRGGPQIRADPRPIGDKNYQLECIRTLMAYLTTHGYTSVVSQKLLGSPSAKEITGIIHFLFKQVDANVKLVKIDEDVPAMFKRLGYPFQINKSALYAAGSPQTWPGLLAALTWLVNLLVYEERANDADQHAQEDEVDGGAEPTLGVDNGGLALFDYAAESYMLFMENRDDECDALQEAVQRQYVEECNALTQETEKLGAEYLEWEAELRLLKKTNPRDALAAEKADLAGDIEKLDAEVNRLQDHTAACAQKVEDKKAYLASKQAESVALEKENALLRDRVNAQQVQTVDYELLMKESQLLGQNLHSLQLEIEELKKKEWDCEVQASRKMKDVEAAVSFFNELARRLNFSLVEGDAELELRINPRADKPNEIIVEDLKGAVKPRIRELKLLSEKLTIAERDESLAMQEKLYECNKATQELADILATLMAQNKKLQIRCKAPREKVEAEEEKVAKEKERLYQEIEHEKNLIKSIQLHKQKLVADFNAKVTAMNEEIERDVNMRYQIVELAMSHKEHVSSSLRNLLAKADSVAEELEGASRWRQQLLP